MQRFIIKNYSKKITHGYRKTVVISFYKCTFVEEVYLEYRVSRLKTEVELAKAAMS